MPLTAGTRLGAYQILRELFRATFTSRSNILLEYREFAPTADGQRFVISAQKERRMSLVTLVTNWSATIGGRP